MRTISNFKFQISSFIIITMMLTSCGAKKEEEPETYKIGFIGPLTGATSMYGNAVMNGAAMYFEELNKNGGINGRQVEFIAMDSEGDKAKSARSWDLSLQARPKSLLRQPQQTDCP